jgi:hypothetical protein
VASSDVCHLKQVFVMWLDLVTYLHHHGHQDLPWYRGEVLAILLHFFVEENIIIIRKLINE